MLGKKWKLQTLVLMVLMVLIVFLVLIMLIMLMSRVCQGVIALTEAWACAPDERRTSGTLGLVYDTDLNRCPRWHLSIQHA